MTPLYSIVIPVCNASSWLRDCLDSIISQTLFSWETICVDCGSTDDSGIMLDTYTIKDNRIIVIHKDNIGLNAARNLGLELAKGKWVWFVEEQSILNNQALSFLNSVYDEFPKVSAICVRDARLVGSHKPKMWPKILTGHTKISRHKDMVSLASFIATDSVRIIAKQSLNGLRFDTTSTSDGRLFYSEYFWSIDEWVLCQSFLVFVEDVKPRKTWSPCKDEMASYLKTEHRLIDLMWQNRTLWMRREMQLYLNEMLSQLYSCFYTKLPKFSYRVRIEFVSLWIEIIKKYLLLGGEIDKISMLVAKFMQWFPILRGLRCVQKIALYLESIRRIGLISSFRVALRSTLHKIRRRSDMRLGVSYNLYDGEELLAASIKSIREEVDYICVVYQNTSNSGMTRDVPIEPYLKQLLNEGLVNELIYYSPSLVEGRHQNEKAKRRLGMLACKRNKCTHFLDMDVDEFYRSAELHKAKKLIEKYDLEVTAVSIIEYLKNPCWRLVSNYMFPPNNENYVFYVPFICKITSRHQIAMFPCLVDPTRGIFRDGRFYLFPKHDIAMHHMSTIRKDLCLKLANSTLASNTDFQDACNAISTYEFHENTKAPPGYDFIGRYLVEKVNNEFDIDV